MKNKEEEKNVESLNEKQRRG